MKKLTVYLVAIIVILACACYIFYEKSVREKRNAERWEENYKEKDQAISDINMTFNEFKKEMSAENDSILKVIKTRPKQFTQITNYYTEYQDTTIEFIFPEYEPKTDNYPFLDKVGCFEISGYLNISDNKPNLTIENRIFNSDFTEVEHFERDTIHFLGLKVANYWRKKWLTRTIVDNCTGDIKTKRINIK